MSVMNRTRLSEKGMVSFTVTLIMMAVITLMVIGFTQVTRRNAREALDRQLSAQAFYAAESGVNVTQASVVNFVNANGTANLATKTSCKDGYEPNSGISPTGDDGNATAGELSPASNVRYTCVLVDPTPSDLQFPVSQAQSTIMPIKTNGVAINSLDFKWTFRPTGSSTTCASGAFTSPTAWKADCDFGVLRVDLMQIPNPALTVSSADQLANQTVTLFMTPRSGHASSQAVAFGTATTGYILSGTGCASNYCKAQLTLPGGVSYYMARFTMVYQDSANVIISGNGDTAKFVGSQAVIDVTGQAQDELRRVQERVALTSTADASTLPLNAVASSSNICKHFSILPKVISDPNDNIINPNNVCQ